MDEEQEEFCTNCKKNVGAANFASHSAFCQRHIKICEVCDEPVPKKSIKEHEEEYHISVKCEKCNASVKKWKLPNHQEICPKRLVTCEFCEADIFVNEAEDHIDFCGSRTELCEVCSSYIMLKHKKKHSELHLYEENYHRGNATGEIHQNMRNEFISKSSEKGIKPDEIYDYAHKGNPIVTEDFQYGSIVEASAPPLETSNKLSENNTVCHLCRQFILWTEYEQHIKTCMEENEFRKCPRCNKNIPPFAWKDHWYNTCRTLKDSRIQATKSESMSVCKSQSTYAFHDELTEDDQAIVCPFCKTPWHPHTIQKHVESCSEKYFQCDLCCKKILEKDKKEHLTNQCKMLQDKTSSDIYECPLCGEYLLEKDKSVHESFACTALLQIHDGPLYSLHEKTSKKYAKETEKNSSETCMNSKEKIPTKELPYREQSCDKNSRKICLYCEKELHPNASEEVHLGICEVFKQISSINDNERDFDQKGAKPKHSKFSEITKPKVGKCTYCKTTLNDNILLFHEKECVHQPIKCPDCSATMYLKDIDKHQCKFVKGSSKGRGGRKNNKIEKSESGGFWNLFSSRKSNPKTHDQYENERNQLYAENMENRYSAIGNKNDDLYFAQQHMIDETKIPCEFCDEQFPASEIVLHMTGCNPREVSLPKPDSVRSRENETSTRQLKRSHDSSITSQHFFSTGRGINIPSTDYKIERHLEQRSEARPGEFLGSYNSEISSKSERIHSGYQNIKEKNQSSSAPKSVWNNDASDVEMEESDPKASSEVLSHNIQNDVNEHSKESTHETSKHSVESDDEMSSMFEYIEGKTTESTIVKNKNISLDEHEQSEDSSVEAASPTKSDIDIEMRTKEFDRLKRFNKTSDIESFKIVPKEYLHSVKSDHQMSGFLNRKEISQEDLYEGTSKMYPSKLDLECSQPDTLEDIMKKQTSHNINKAELNLYESKKEMSNFRFCGNRMKNSVSETGKLHDFDIDECDVYHKTNALGYVIVSEDESTKIRRRRIKDTDNAYQNNILRSKYEDQDNIQMSQKGKNENSAQTDSCLSENSNETLNSKYKCQDKNTVERSHDKRNVTGTLDVSSYIPETTLEMLKSKYEYQNDSAIETRNEERIKSKTQSLSPSVCEKSIEVLRSNYKYQYDDDDDANQTNQSDEVQGVSITSSRTANEILRSKHNNENDYVHKLSLKERVESRTQGYSSSMSENPLEMSISKHKYQYNDGILASDYKEYISKIQGASSMSETSKEILRLKNKHQNDSISEIIQKEKMKSRTQDALSSVPEKPFEMSRSKYKYQHDISQTSQKEEIKNKTKDIPPSMADPSSIELLRSKYMCQDDDNEIKPNQNSKVKSTSGDSSSSLLEKSKEPSKHYTLCPICKQTIKWIDYNTHLPACASSSGRCARCGEEVLESDFKEHVLVKCSKKSGKVHPVNESIQRTSTSRIKSFDQVLESLISDENSDVRKSKFEEKNERKQYESARIRPFVRENCSESNKSTSASRSNSAFKIEPALHTSGFNYRKSINNSENPKDKHLKEATECPKSSFSDEDLAKWCKWRNQRSDDS